MPDWIECSKLSIVRSPCRPRTEQQKQKKLCVRENPTHQSSWDNSDRPSPCPSSRSVNSDGQNQECALPSVLILSFGSDGSRATWGRPGRSLFFEHKPRILSIGTSELVTHRNESARWRKYGFVEAVEFSKMESNVLWLMSFGSSSRLVLTATAVTNVLEEQARWPGGRLVMLSAYKH